MQNGIERLVDRVGPSETALSGAALSEVESAVRDGDVARLAATDGHLERPGRIDVVGELPVTPQQPVVFLSEGVGADDSHRGAGL